MAPFHHRLVRNLLPIPFDQTGPPGPNPVGNNTPDDMKGSKNPRNNANVAQYPYPSPSPPINGGQDTPSTTPSRNQANSIPVNAQGGDEGPQTTVKAPQQASESTTVSTSIVSTTTTTSSSSVSSSSTTLSSVSSQPTTTGSTLSVPPPNFSTRLTTIPPSLSFMSQTFTDTESSSISASQSTAADATPTPSPPIQLSPTAIGIFIAIGGTILLVAFVSILRCTLRQYRHRRRRMKESAFDFAGSNEKWETGNGEKGGGMGAGRSPSTIFGGNERLTPQPSWTTFHEADRGGTASPYPLGLLPPPVNTQRVPSLRAQTGLGISHQTFHTGYSNYNHSTTAQQVDPRNQSFEPPTITITNSSPRQSAPWIVKQSRDRNGAVAGASKPSASGTDISPANSYNRVSVYSDPVRGAQLVEPPRLTLVNDDPSLSESDGGPRQSGWSSWDDSVGLELGVTIDRKHLPPRRRSRIPVSKGKKEVSPLRITLAPVQEVSDTSDPEKFPARSPANSSSKLHPQGPIGSQGQLRRGPSSPTSLRRSPRSVKSASPRALKQPQPQTLYDLPQFEAVSPSGNSSICVASPNSVPNSPLREPERKLDRGTSSSKRRSKRSSRRASSKHPPPAAAVRPSSVVSEALSDMYAYVQAYALSSTESEEIQVRRRSKPSGKPKSPRSPRSKDNDGFAHGSPLAMGSLPAVSHAVGTLMMKAYGEEGSIPSPSILQLSERGKGKKGSGSRSGRKEIPIRESNRVNVPQASHSVGLGLTIHKQRSQPQQQQQSRTPQSARQRRSDASAGNFSPQSEYSEHPNQQPSPRRCPDSGRSLALPQQRGVPSLPPPGMPNLHQLKLMRDMPDYRSPTYSVYGMYRDENRASPLQNSPVQYRYASTTTSGKARNGIGNGSWRADVI